MTEHQLQKEAAGGSRIANLSLEEIERELRALREYEGSRMTSNESILVGICIADLEAAREGKLRERRVAEAADPRPGKRKEE